MNRDCSMRQELSDTDTVKHNLYTLKYTMNQNQTAEPNPKIFKYG